MEQSKEKIEINVDNFNLLEYWNEGKGSFFEGI